VESCSDARRTSSAVDCSETGCAIGHHLPGDYLPVRTPP
jgi:hypothetical protein